MLGLYLFDMGCQICDQIKSFRKHIQFNILNAPDVYFTEIRGSNSKSEIYAWSSSIRAKINYCPSCGKKIKSLNEKERKHG